jgi:hypothetical protein
MLSVTPLYCWSVAPMQDTQTPTDHVHMHAGILLNKFKKLIKKCAHDAKLHICIKTQESQPDSKICSILSHEH